MPTTSTDLPTGTATFLFTDIQGSTKLVQELGIDRWKPILDTHYQLLRKEFGAHNGHEVNTEGDAFFMAFANASDAVAACAAGQRALYAHDWPPDAVIRVRMGLHTGEAAMVGGDYMGLEIHRAARIASSAHGGQVVLSDTTRTLVDGSLPDGVGLIDLGEHRLKDLARQERIWQLRIDGLPSEFPALKSLDLIPNNLPVQLTSFVGRDKELEEGLGLLDANRLLTLTGPGGTGKTRLSLQIAAEASDGFKDGVFFVPLAPITDPELVASTVLEAMSIRDVGSTPPAELLLTHLRDRETLLVLDNFEQLLPAAPYIGEMLKAAPKVKAIASSRAALKVYGEQEFPVPPLGVPGSGAMTLDSLGQFAAVQLFIDRAVAIKPDFAVTNENAPAVAAITELVDGLPLAIELAAARIKLLTPQAMLTRLEGRLGELGGGARDLPERQQTLRGAIAWSYELLDDDIKKLMDCFSVFVRGAGLEQLEHVCGPAVGVDILDGLEVLVEHNLIRPVQDAEEPRFFMLHVIREFAIERLAQREDSVEIHQRHAEVFTELSEAQVPNFMGPDPKSSLDRLELEHDNIRAALSWAVKEGNADIAGRLVNATWRFMQMRGYLYEGRERAEEVLAMPTLVGSPRAHYLTLEAAGGIVYWLGDDEAIRKYYNRALDVARTTDDKRFLAEALYNASYPDNVTGQNVGKVKAVIQEAEEVYRDIGDEPGVAKTQWALGMNYYYSDPPQWEKAIEKLTESLTKFREWDDKFSISWATYTLSDCYIGVQDYVKAGAALRETLRTFAAIDDSSSFPLIFASFAVLALAEGQIERAAVMAGARDTVEEATGARLLNMRTTAHQKLELEAKVVGEREPDAFARGKAMSVEEAIAFALEETPRG